MIKKRWQRVDTGTGQTTKSMEEEDDDDQECKLVFIQSTSYYL